MADRADLTVIGRFGLCWEGQPVAVSSRRARALVALLAMRGRPMPRERLAEWLWRPGALRNLRQEVYVLRRLPGADRWLLLDGDAVAVRARTDLETIEGALARGEPVPELPEGDALADLDGAGAPPFDEWLGMLRLRVHGARTAVELRAIQGAIDRGELSAARARLEPLLLTGRDEEGVARLARRLGLPVPPSAVAPHTEGAASPSDRLARLLVLAGDRELPPQVLELALGAGPSAVAAAWEALVAAGVGAEELARRTAGTPPGLWDATRRLLADGYRRAGRHADAAEQLLVLGDPNGAAAALLADGSPESAEQALSHAQDPALRRAALERLFDHHRSGASGDPERWLEALDALAVETQEIETLESAATRRAILAGQRGQLEPALAAAAEAERHARSRGSAAGIARAAIARGNAQLVAGRFAEARATFAAAAESAPERERVTLLNGLGAAAAYAGDLGVAEAAHEDALAIARRLGDRVAAGRLLCSLGADAQRRSAHEAAIRRFEEAATIAEDANDLPLLATSLLNLAHVLRREGRAGRARVQVSRAIEVARQTQVPRTLGLLYLARAELERDFGRYAEARAWSERAAELLTSDPVNLHTAQFDAALAQLGETRAAEDWSRARAAATALRRLDRPEVAAEAALEVALLAPLDEPALDTAPTEPVSPRIALLAALVRLRAAVVTGSAADAADRQHVARACDRGFPERVRATALLAEIEPDGGWIARCRAAVAEQADGLLPAQKEALVELAAAWLCDPR